MSKKKNKGLLNLGQISKNKVDVSADEILTATDEFEQPTDVKLDESAILDDTSIDESVDMQFSDGAKDSPMDDGDAENFFFDMGNVTLLNGNTIYFNAYVEKYTVDIAIALLKRVNHHIATVEIEHPEMKGILRPKFIINSNGGSVVQGLRLFDRLKNNIYDVSTIVDGMAASMGIILAVAGKKKQATPNSVLMIHQLSAGAQGKFRELMDYAKFWVKLQNKLSRILIDNTNAKENDINKFMDGETFILAEDALKMGLIDEIVHL